MLNELNETSKELELKININETKYMTSISDDRWKAQDRKRGKICKSTNTIYQC